MTYDDFIGQVQYRARLGTSGDAIRATRATLEVLGQRLFGGEAKDLAAQLPQEIGYYLLQAKTSERFDLAKFYQRVSEHERVDLPEAVFHARVVMSTVSRERREMAAVFHVRVVMSVVRDAVSPGEFEDVQAQLPAEYASLFEWHSEAAMARN